MVMHIFLLGFMGSGKTSVGITLARRLSMPFYDTDEMLVKEAGRSIAQIFAEEGESKFRERETQTLRQLMKHAQAVVATGGGILLRKENRSLIKKGYPIVLNASQTTVIDRLKHEKGERPLLSSPAWQETLKALYAERKSLYDAIPHRIDTDGKTIEDIVSEIATLVLPVAKEKT